MTLPTKFQFKFAAYANTLDNSHDLNDYRYKDVLGQFAIIAYILLLQFALLPLQDHFQA
jgi:hypothetical protein